MSIGNQPKLSDPADHRTISLRGHNVTRRVRVIAADDRWTACASVPNCIEQNNWIDLECARWISGNVRRRQDIIDPVTLSQQQSAHLTHGLGSSQRHNPFDQPA